MKIMMILLLCVCLLGIIPKSAFADNRTSILEPSKGIYVALADMGFYNHTDYTSTSLHTSFDQIKKVIDLTGLKEEVWNEVEAVEVSIFMYTEGGGDENFDIVVNGRVNSFPMEGLAKTGKGWYDFYLPIGWYNFSIPKEQLMRGINEIIVRKSAETGRGGRIKIGIDMFRNVNCSFVSTDGGKNWRDRPLNDYKHAGEYMIRLTLYSNKELMGKKAFSHDNLPALPPVELNPAVKQLPPVPANQPVIYQPGDKHDILENGWMRIRISHSNGFSLKEITHKSMGKNALKDLSKSNPFLMEIDGQRYYSEDFTVKTKEMLTSEPEKCEILYFLYNDTIEMEANLYLKMEQNQELKIGLSVKNVGTESRMVKVAFPLLTGIGWGSDFSDDYYLYPYRSGAIMNLPIKFLSAYGGGRTYFQQMVSYSPKAGGGLYLRVNDRSGEYKILHLTKSNKRELPPTFSFQPILVDMRNGRANEDLILLKPFSKVSGTNMAFSYQGRKLEPNDKWIFSTSVLGVMNGDWHKAMDSYRKWYESWSYKRPYPNKLTDVFNLASPNLQSDAVHHPDKGYLTDFLNKWSRTPDILEYTSYWEWDLVTDEYMEEMQKMGRIASIQKISK